MAFQYSDLFLAWENSQLPNIEDAVEMAMVCDRMVIALGRAKIPIAIRYRIPYHGPYGNPHPIPYLLLQKNERDYEGLICGVYEADEMQSEVTKR